MSEKRKKNKEFSQVGPIINDLLRTIRPGADSNMFKIWGIWDKTLESDISKNTRPAAFKGSLLIVRVDNSSIIQQLHFRKNDIIKKLNTALGKETITEIRFKVGTK